jgi:hypothetical protein
MPNIQSKPMHQGAFVLKLKTRDWRLCLVKQVPEQSSSCWMLFGQNMKCDRNMKCGQNMKDKTTFQMEFQTHQETTLINHIVNMADVADVDEETCVEIRLVLIRESPKISHIGSLWALKGLEMYRKQLDTASGLVNSLHQDVNMLRLSPQIEQIEQIEDSPQIDRHHSMQTRSKAKH